MREPFSIDVRFLAIGFAIAGNMVVAVASFPMVPILALLHGVDTNYAETVRLTEAARIAVYFAFMPLVALLLVRWTPVTPLSPSPPDPLYDDVASTIQTTVASGIAVLAAIAAALRLTGLGVGDQIAGLLQVAIFTMASIYMVLLADGRKPLARSRTSDRAVVFSIVVICIFFEKRDALLLAIPLLLAERSRVRPVWIMAFVGAAVAILLFSMAMRGNLDWMSNVLRVLGNQFKYLERYSLNFGIYDQCFGPATLISFFNRGNTQAFYHLIDDPVTLAPGAIFGWNSSNLLERLNYAYCSVNVSFLLYFVFLSVLLLLEKKLGDVRYFRVAFLTIIFAFEGFNFYNVPQVTALVLLFLSGFWRIGRSILEPTSDNRIAAKDINSGGV